MIHVAVLHHSARRLNPYLERWMLDPCGPVRSLRTVTDGQTVWEAARIAWEGFGTADGAWGLVLHDDMRPCGDFSKVLGVLAESDHVYSLWHNQTHYHGELMPHIFAPAGALLLPCKWIPEFLAWQDAHVKPDYRCDDTRLAMWCAASGRLIHVPYPNLVQHEGPESVARPGGECLRSPTFTGWREVYGWHPVPGARTAGERRSFLISRAMHMVAPYDDPTYWRDICLPPAR